MTKVSAPQSQRQFHLAFPAFVLGPKDVTMSRLNFCPIKSMRCVISVLTLLFLFGQEKSYAQGTIGLMLTQQFSFTNCTTFTNSCGTPLIGGLLYTYAVGTVNAVQLSYQDTGLTIPNPWPLVLDANGRVPPFYLANGSVHARLTDSGGVTQFDYPNLLVVGPSSGGGGGGSVDPTTIASTGDIKFRATGEFVTGWVKLNGQTIGGAASGASGLASATALNLFTYLWANCTQSHCPVSSGSRGASALADYNASYTIQLPDLRGRAPWGLDDMGNTASGRLLAGQITSGGGDTVTTPAASGGASTTTLTLGQLPTFTPSGTISGTIANVWILSGANPVSNAPNNTYTFSPSNINGSSFAFTGNPIGSGQAANTVSPLLLGSWFMKL
jgi:hypothetical protein